MLSMKNVIDKKGKIVSWIVELVIGVVSGVVSGIILARLVPDGSMAPEPTASGGGAVTQQVMAANGDVAMVAGNRNYTHIGDDNSTHVTVAGESGSRRADSDGDMWLMIGLGFAAFVVIAIFLMRYYEILVGLLVITSVFLMTMSLLTAGLSLRSRRVSKPLRSSIVASFLAVTSTYVTYWSCFILSTGKSSLSIPDLSRMLSEATGDDKLVPFAEAFDLLSAERAFPYVSVVFMAMLVTAVLCFFALGMMIREFCERRVAAHRAGSVSGWLIDHLPVPGWRYILGVLLLACVPALIVVLFRNVQPTWLS
jgi:membrane protein